MGIAPPAETAGAASVEVIVRTDTGATLSVVQARSLGAGDADLKLGERVIVSAVPNGWKLVPASS